jgi:hypothetical protein
LTGAEPAGAPAAGAPAAGAASGTAGDEFFALLAVAGLLADADGFFLGCFCLPAGLESCPMTPHERNNNIKITPKNIFMQHIIVRFPF